MNHNSITTIKRQLTIGTAIIEITALSRHFTPDINRKISYRLYQQWKGKKIWKRRKIMFALSILSSARRRRDYLKNLMDFHMWFFSGHYWVSTFFDVPQLYYRGTDSLTGAHKKRGKTL